MSLSQASSHVGQVQVNSALLLELVLSKYQSLKSFVTSASQVCQKKSLREKSSQVFSLSEQSEARLNLFKVGPNQDSSQVF